MAIIKKYNEGTSQWEPILVGQKGDTGEGVPAGGSTGQVLAKASGTNYDTAWEAVEDLGARVGTGISTYPADSNNYYGWPSLTLNGNRIIATATDRIRYWPFEIDRPARVHGWVVTCWANTSGTATTFRAGIYEMSSNLQPGALATELGTVSVPATTTGAYETTLVTPVDLSPGVYTAAWIASSTTPTWRGTNDATKPLIRGSVGGNFCVARYISPIGQSATSSLPNPAPIGITADVDANAWGPLFFIRWEWL
jgi:hypothetical protein